MRRRSGIDSIEAGLADANDGHGKTVDHQFLADDFGIGREARHPVTVAEHGVRSSAGRGVIVRREHASHRRSNAEVWKVSPGDHFSLDPLRASGETEAHIGDVAAEHSAEDRILIAEVRVHRVGDFVAAVVAAVMLAAGPQQHKLLWIFDRKRTQQHLIDQGENSGVGSNAERQRQGGNQQERRGFAEGPHGEEKILVEAAHGVYTGKRYKGYMPGLLVPKSSQEEGGRE